MENSAHILISTRLQTLGHMMRPPFVARRTEKLGLAMGKVTRDTARAVLLLAETDLFRLLWPPAEEI